MSLLFGPWWKRVRGRRPARGAAPATRGLLALEGLEDRNLLSAAAPPLVFWSQGVSALVAPGPDSRPLIVIDATGALQGPAAAALGNDVRDGRPSWAQLAGGDGVLLDVPAGFAGAFDVLLVHGTDTFRVTLKLPDGHGEGQVALRVADVTGDGRPDLLVWGRDLAGSDAGTSLVLTPAVIARQGDGSPTANAIITLTSLATPPAVTPPADPLAGAGDVSVATLSQPLTAARADVSAPGRGSDDGSSPAASGHNAAAPAAAAATDEAAPPPSHAAPAPATPVTTPGPTAAPAAPAAKSAGGTPADVSPAAPTTWTAGVFESLHELAPGTGSAADAAPAVGHAPELSTLLHSADALPNPSAVVPPVAGDAPAGAPNPTPCHPAAVDYLLGDPGAPTVYDLLPAGPAVPPLGPFPDERTQVLAEGRAAEGRAAPRGPLLAAGVGGILAQALALGGTRQADASPGADADLAQSAGEAQLMVADLIQSSAETFTKVVQGFYRRFLGRSAEGGEEQGWVQMLLAGRTEEDVLSNFLSTPEYVARAAALGAAGSPDERCVQSLYTDLLNRPATEDELSGWLSALPALGVAGVALFLLRSEEQRRRAVSAYYRDLAGRSATDAEAAAWASSPFDLLTIRLFLRAQLRSAAAVAAR